MHFYKILNFPSGASRNFSGLIVTAGSLLIAWAFIFEMIFYPEYINPLNVALFFIFSIGIPAIYFGITAILDFTRPAESFISKYDQKTIRTLDGNTPAFHPETDQPHDPRSI
jgi:hypothetical protein